MSSRLILSKTNAWISVSIPRGLDPLWLDSDIWYFAAMFVGAQEKGFPDKRAEQLAEALVCRRLYPGIHFHSDLEKDLEKL